MGVGCWVQNVCLPENRAVRVRSPIDLATGMVGTSEVPPCGRLFFLLRLMSSLSIGFAVDVRLENLRRLKHQDFAPFRPRSDLVRWRKHENQQQRAS